MPVLVGVPPALGVFELVPNGVKVRVAEAVRLPVADGDDPAEGVTVTKAVRVAVPVMLEIALRDRLDVVVPVELPLFARVRVPVVVGLSAEARDLVVVVVGVPTARDLVAVVVGEGVPTARDLVTVAEVVGVPTARDLVVVVVGVPTARDLVAVAEVGGRARVGVTLLVKKLAGLGLRAPPCPPVNTNRVRRETNLICI